MNILITDACVFVSRNPDCIVTDGRIRSKGEGFVKQ